ncbi:MAG: hypothetical protein AAGJ28_21820 [Pseudomonadota bacterium]
MRLALGIALVLLALLSHPQPAKTTPIWGTELDALVGQEGVTITYNDSDPERQSRGFSLPGDVWIFEIKEPTRTYSISEDRSGKGAVICLYWIYTGIRDVIDACSDIDSELAEALDDANARIENFVLENSLLPVTDAQIMQGRAALKRRHFQSVGATETKRVQCLGTESGRSFAQMLTHYGSEAELKAEVDKLLSIPRHPVNGPCL